MQCSCFCEFLCRSEKCPTLAPCLQLNTLVARSDDELAELATHEAGQGMYYLASDEECQSMVAAMNRTHAVTTLVSKLTRRGKQREHISLS